MKPLWEEYPGIPWGSIGWRMGAGEDYSIEWNKWYGSLSKEEKEKYKSKWPEHEGWQGFYAFIEGGVMPPWVVQRREEFKKAALPPEAHESSIKEYKRIVGLIKHYFTKPPVFVRAIDEEFDGLYCDPSGFVWGVVLPPKSSPCLKRYTGRLIGDNNLEVNQPIT